MGYEKIIVTIVVVIYRSIFFKDLVLVYVILRLKATLEPRGMMITGAI